MLQQTQVERVKDFFNRFIKQFPNVESLAASNEQQVLKFWEGLGYYRRARNLLAAAQIVINTHGGHFPESVRELRSLPGIGRYSAGAIASIAFDLPEPIVEANTRRVLARLSAHRGPLHPPKSPFFPPACLPQWLQRGKWQRDGLGRRILSSTTFG